MARQQARASQPMTVAAGGRPMTARAGRQPMTSMAGRRVAAILLAALLAVLTVHVAGVCLDFLAAYRYPYELDYGEGIVWQQALLIPGPHMYSASRTLPFIVFHYPPLFYLLTHLALLIQPDYLAAGRLVSSLCTLLVVPSVAGLVLIVTRPAHRRSGGLEIAIAIAVALLLLCLHAVRSWGMVMRVDMVAIAAAMAGLLVGAWADGRFWGTTLALLLCVAAVFAKQTQLPAGVAVFLFAVWRNPRGGLGAGLVAAAAGLGALGVMQFTTGGGFLFNIVAANINRIELRRAYWAFLAEHDSFPFMLLAVVAALWVTSSVLPSLLQLRLPSTVRELSALRRGPPAPARRVLVLLHFTLATLMLSTMLKAGGNYNYLLEWLCSGAVLTGVLLIDLARRATWRGLAFPVALLGLTIFAATLPERLKPDHVSAAEAAWQDAVIERIAAASKPVISDDMTLLMRAHKPVFYEPSIVTELASVGRWDETPLLQMFRNHAFAFVVVTSNIPGGGDLRTPAVDAAIREAYPRVERVGPRFWILWPAA